MSSLLTRIQRSKHFQYGVPFFLFIFGGKFVLEDIRSVRYDKSINPNSGKNLVTPEEAFAELEKEYPGAKFKYQKNNKTAEEELEELDKKYNWDDPEAWENKRGPRPWEGTIEKRQIKRVPKEPLNVKDLL